VSFDGFIGARLNLSFLDRAKAAWNAPDLRPAWKEARKPARADQREHAKEEEGPDGPWIPRRSRTRARSKSGRRRRARKLLGRLPRALQIKHDKRRLLIRSRVRWSGVHQEGGVAGRGAQIPARTFLWPSDELLGKVAEIVARVLAKQGFGG